MSEYDIKDEPIVISKYLLDMFLNPRSNRYADPEHPSDLMALYLFYYYTAKWQKTNSVRATTGYVAEGLKWSIPRVQKAKKALMELGLIEDARPRDETGRLGKAYIQVKFVWGAEATKEVVHHPRKSPPSGKTTEWKIHPVETPMTNALSDNSGNALSENNRNASKENRESAPSPPSLESTERKTAKSLPLSPKPPFPPFKVLRIPGKNSAQVRLLNSFIEETKRAFPLFQPPKKAGEIQRWVMAIGDILEDGHEPETIMKVVKFALEDGFWDDKVIDPWKLRKNINAVLAAMPREKEPGEPYIVSKNKDFILYSDGRKVERKKAKERSGEDGVSSVVA